MALESTDAKNKLEDLSGIKIQPGDNPYKALIQACKNNTVCSRACKLVMLAQETREERYW